MEDVEVRNTTYYYIVCDNFGTGEGRTVDVLITRAYPRSEDYDDNYKVKPDSTPEHRAMREFIMKHGAWSAAMAEELTREEMLKRYKHYLPELAIKIINDDSVDGPGNFNYSATLHLNYS